MNQTAANMEGNESAGDRATSTALPSYEFHDPTFVTWWLGSLFLLKPEDQIAIATSLHEAIHEPMVQAELAAFVALTGGAESAEAPVFEGTRGEQVIQVVKYKLREIWVSNPWFLGLAGAGLTFVIGKGIWFLANEALRIVF